MVARSGDDAEEASILGAAMRALCELDISDPPITPERVLKGLGLRTEALPSFDMDRLTANQRRLFGSVRGLLSLSDHTIYLCTDLTMRQIPWVIYHEAGHFDIGWHREMLYLDSAYTLGQSVRERMEQEANEYAGHLQFLGDRFAREACDLPFGLEAAKSLADRYGSSYESAIRRYVETRPHLCFCEVFEIVEAGFGIRTLKYHYFIKPRARAGYWKPDYEINDLLPLEHPTVRLLNEGRLDRFAIYRGTRYNKSVRMAYAEDVFSNGYQVFALVRA